MEESKKNPVLKVLLIILGFLAVIALCVLSSRFSWFGTAEENSSQNSGNTSINSEVSIEETSVTEKPDDNSSQTENTDTSEAITSSDDSSEATEGTSGTEAPETPASQVQTTPAPETEQTTTTTTKPVTPAPETEQTTTTTTTVTTTTTTTVTEAPKPLWTETECNKEMYITVSCYSRKEAIPGSATVSLLNYGTKVKVVATTDTSYSKLSDGSYVHNDYLSSSKPAETTVTTTTKNPQTDTPAQLPAGFGEGITSNPPSSCNALEIEVFNLINDIRVQNGVKKLKWDPTAYTAAKTRVREIVTCWGHYRADGTRCYSVYGEGEDPFHIFSHIGENIASGQHTAKEVVDSWMNSSSHRKNILNPDFENIAIAFYEADDHYHYYWVQEFTTYK
ncbi:MAG: CAP domain-containing protein [Ruminiclostridium sp.]|nr:CAP domain-containing protein [Ruminiclostridium sp.]